MSLKPRRTLPAALIALLVLVLVKRLLFTCDSAESSSEDQEAIFETYHSAVAGLNDLNQQAIAEEEASDAKQSLTDSGWPQSFPETLFRDSANPLLDPLLHGLICTPGTAEVH